MRRNEREGYVIEYIGDQATEDKRFVGMSTVHNTGNLVPFNKAKIYNYKRLAKSSITGKLNHQFLTSDEAEVYNNVFIRKVNMKLI